MLIDYIETLWPGGIGIIGGVTHIIDAKGEREAESLREVVGDGYALIERLGLRVAHVIALLEVGLHLPLILRMRFSNVDGQKVGVIFVIVIELHDIAHLATEGRSSKAAKHQHQRPRLGFLAQMETRAAV